MGKVWSPQPDQRPGAQLVPISHRADFPTSMPMAIAMQDPGGGMQMLVLGGMSQLLHVAAIISAGMCDGDDAAIASRAVARAKAVMAACEAEKPKQEPLPGG